jgi:hypothetical protein
LPGVERVQLADVHESLPIGELAAPVADDAASPEGAQQYLQCNHLEVIAIPELTKSSV